jgi:hypothetical protein
VTFSPLTISSLRLGRGVVLLRVEVGRKEGLGYRMGLRRGGVKGLGLTMILIRRVS